MVLLKHRKLLVASFVPLLLVFWGLACNGNEAANLPLTETATSTRESPTLTAEEAAEQQAFEGAAATWEAQFGRCYPDTLYAKTAIPTLPPDCFAEWPVEPRAMCVALLEGEPFDYVCDALGVYAANCLDYLYWGESGGPQDCIAASRGNTSYEDCWKPEQPYYQQMCDRFFVYLCGLVTEQDFADPSRSLEEACAFPGGE